MIVPKDIITTVFAEPFRPFRINMASGKSYEIRHPEVVQVGKSNLTIFTPLVEGEEGDYGQPWKKVSLMLIESVEPLDISAPKDQK